MHDALRVKSEMWENVSGLTIDLCVCNLSLSIDLHGKSGVRVEPVIGREAEDVLS